MTDWTRPESYNAKTIAWTQMRERLDGGPVILPRGNLGQWAEWFPREYSEIMRPDGGRASRVRAAFGGRRSGKTEGIRSMGFDLARNPDQHVEAVWINGRLWLL